jgi:RND superfamily putative drug exporter
MSTLSPRGLARLSAHHPWAMLGAWVVGLLVLVGSAFALGPNLTSQIEFTSDEEAQIAFDALEDKRGREPLFEQIVVQHATLTVDDPEFAAVVARVFEDVQRLSPEHVEFATSFYDGPAAGNEALVSADRHTTIVQAKLVGDIDDAVTHVEPLFEALHEIDGEDGFTVVTSGFGSINTTFETTAESDLQAETNALPVAFLVLIVVFGAIAAAFVPLVLAFIAIFVAMASAFLISQIFPVSFFITNMIFMIGLALGIDYTLFIVERFREERALGHDKIDAIEIAGDTASRAVLFSGLTVVISLLGMLIVPTNIFRALGGGAILVAIASIIVSLTLLPAVLALLGDNVNRLSVQSLLRRVLRRRPGPEPVAAEVHADRGFWAGAARTVMARPWISVFLSAGLLIALTLPYARIQLGFAGASSLPESSDAARAFAILDAEFSAGFTLPTEIVVLADDVSDPAILAAVGDLERLVAADGAEFGALGIVLNRSQTDGPSADGTVHLTTVALPGDSSSDEALAALKRLRSEIVPATFGGVSGAEVFVGGQTAFSEDFFSVVNTYTPIVFALVLSLSFLLLLMVFRSLVVPIKAIVMNLLSVGAAYGMLVLIFQEGVGADLLGFQQVDTIEAWVPLFLFMILFGLSMDYHVFLLSRIREHYDNGVANARSVAFGLRSTGKIITGAAAIMVVVFGGFALGDLVMFQQFGFGLAFAVILDATVVRMVLVPAAMELLGDRNWYLPNWLAWLPDLRVEGGSARPPAGVASPAIAGGDR